MPTPLPHAEPPERWLELSGVRHRNLQGVDLKLPVGRLVAMTGVSGSGKSSLALEVLAPAALRALGQAAPLPGAHAELRGMEAFQRVVVVDQQPLGRSPRVCPATYVELLEPLRQTYAAMPEAKARGYAASRFSFLNKAGQCASCRGLGALRPEPGAWSEDWTPCPACQGGRYDPSLDAITFKGKSIAQALRLTIAEATDFLANQPKVARRLATLAELGLGYLTLGQPANTLSGGEAQRLKLAAALATEDDRPALFILDEPTAGLHLHDVAGLAAIFRRLVDRGHTVLAIEHHLELVRQADWVIDLGPGGGPAGGLIIAAGKTSQVSQADTSTARSLRQSP